MQFERYDFQNHVLSLLLVQFISCYAVYRRERNVSMGYFKENEIACINIFGIPKDWKYRFLNYSKNFYIRTCWDEPPFRANLLFGYAQSGPERTSFSGSTVGGSVLCRFEFASSRLTMWVLLPSALHSFGAMRGSSWGSGILKPVKLKSVRVESLR